MKNLGIGKDPPRQCRNINGDGDFHLGSRNKVVLVTRKIDDPPHCILVFL
jgi:hypothetical protein